MGDYFTAKYVHSITTLYDTGSLALRLHFLLAVAGCGCVLRSRMAGVAKATNRRGSNGFPAFAGASMRGFLAVLAAVGRMDDYHLVHYITWFNAREFVHITNLRVHVDQ